MHALFAAFAADPLLLAVAVGMLGLLVGSFLNVVIGRLPKMLEADWQTQAREYLELEPAPKTPTLNLASPPSRCPHCGHQIRAHENIPVLSWVLLRGRCSACRAPISAQYPIVEMLTAALSVVCAWRFGWSPALGAALALTWMLIALAVIDLQTQLLPDILTIPLQWLGLALSLLPVFVTPAASITGALAGYLSLWAISRGFQLLTGRVGMGDGDLKLFSALGAWFGGLALPVVILLSSVVGAAVGLALIVFRRHDRQIPIPFGPYLAGAGWLTLIWGDRLGNLPLQR